MKVAVCSNNEVYGSMNRLCAIGFLHPQKIPAVADTSESSMLPARKIHPQTSLLEVQIQTMASFSCRKAEAISVLTIITADTIKSISVMRT